MKQKQIIRGAIIGAGFMGETHLKGYNHLEHVNLCAVIDPYEERAKLIADPFNIPTYKTLNEAVIEQSLDFIDVCVPTPYHVDAIASGFRNNCHVLVEKPLTASMEDIQKIRNLMDESECRLMVAHVCRFMPQYVFAKKTIDSGRLGRPIAFSALRYSEPPSWSLNNWINDRNLSGGTIVDLSIHDIDIANWFFGSPCGFNASEVTKVTNGPAHVSETIVYNNSYLAHIEASHLLPKGFPLETKFQLILENGIISFEAKNNEISLQEYTNEKWKDIDIKNITNWEDPYTEEVDDFTSCLIEGKEFRVTFDDAVKAVYSALSLKESINSGKRVGNVS